MGDLVTWEIKGLKELEKELLQLPEKVARRALARAAYAGAVIVRDEARKNARAAELVDTGLLVKSIRIKKVRNRDWRTTQIYGIGHLGKGWYGKLYEYGFKNPVGERRGRPHIRPALDENLGRITNAIEKSLWNGIIAIQTGKIARPK